MDVAGVEAYFASLDDVRRQALRALEAVILETASDSAVGRVDVALRWGVPSYSSAHRRRGTPVRIGTHGPRAVALFVHCQTPLIDAFRREHGSALDYDGARAIVLDPAAELPTARLRACVRQAFTYRARELTGSGRASGERHPS